METTARLIHQFLETSARHLPNKTAVICERYRATYFELNSWSNRLAHSLIKAGVKPNNKIALLCENSIEFMLCYYGVLKTGGVVAALNIDIKSDTLAGLLNELQPKALIVSPRFEKTARALDLMQSGKVQVLVIGSRALGDTIAGNDYGNSDLSIDPTSCAMIVYTSGSAGKPKGVMLSHANIVANTRAIISYLKLTVDDVQMVVLPFSYVMGLSLLNTHIAVGGSIIINNKFAYMASILKQMAEECVTGFAGVPSTYAHLLFRSPLAQYRDKLPALRYCSQAGGHMPKHIKLELMSALPAHTQLFVMYGATEASARLTYVPPEQLRRKIDSIGKPIRGVTMRVLSSGGAVLGAGEIGELVAQGDNIMLGYFGDDEGTKKVLTDDGYHTGDLGYVDDEGFFYVIGRKDDQVKIGGHRVNLQEIENAVIESGHAFECIIFAIGDVLLGQKLGGLVVPIKKTADSVSPILNFCRRVLPRYKIPAPLFAVGSIPKNISGKPDREKSLQLFEEMSRKDTHGHA